MNNVLFFLFIIFISFLLTELIRRYTLKINLLDLPNERSSHSIATPRGGGLSIVVIFLACVGLYDLLQTNIVIAFVGAGVLVATIGFWDDYKHVAVKWRLLSHFVAVFWSLYWLGEVPEFQLFGIDITTGWLSVIFFAFFLVWFLNLFNFMDGIDGIAASEAIFISCGGAFFSWMNGSDNLTFIALILAASTVGFLISNWPPAKIFMGDVGSGFLGLTIGILAYANALEGISIWVWVILFAVFLVDSTYTLIMRFFMGEKWYGAHCSHAYQHAARRFGHKKVTITVSLINIFWLFPFAYLSYIYPDWGLIYLLVASLPLLFLVKKFNAGLN